MALKGKSMEECEECKAPNAIMHYSREGGGRKRGKLILLVTKRRLEIMLSCHSLPLPANSLGCFQCCQSCHEPKKTMAAHRYTHTPPTSEPQRPRTHTLHSLLRSLTTPQSEVGAKWGVKLESILHTQKPHWWMCLTVQHWCHVCLLLRSLFTLTISLRLENQLTCMPVKICCGD